MDARLQAEAALEKERDVAKADVKAEKEARLSRTSSMARQGPLPFRPAYELAALRRQRAAKDGDDDGDESLPILPPAPRHARPVMYAVGPPLSPRSPPPFEIAPPMSMAQWPFRMGVAAGPLGRVLPGGPPAVPAWSRVCNNEEEPVTLESIADMSATQDLVSILPAAGGYNAGGTCYRRESLLESMRAVTTHEWIQNPRFPELGRANADVTYYRMPHDGSWIDQAGLDAVAAPKPPWTLFIMQSLGRRLLGKSFGQSAMHGQVWEVFTLLPVQSRADFRQNLAVAAPRITIVDPYDTVVRVRPVSRSSSPRRGRNRSRSRSRSRSPERKRDDLKDQKDLKDYKGKDYKAPLPVPAAAASMPAASASMSGALTAAAKALPAAQRREYLRIIALPPGQLAALCAKFRADPTRNPETGRPINADGDIADRWRALCP